MKTWWIRNRWYLVALVLIVPLALVASMILRWFPYVERQPVPEAVALGETVEYSGARVQLTELRVLDGGRWNAPAGTDVVVATLEVDVVEPVSTMCKVELVSDEAGFERFWTADSFVDSDYDIPDEFETLCSFSEAGAYGLQLTYLVPAGQVEDPAVQFTSTAALPRVLRLS